MLDVTEGVGDDWRPVNAHAAVYFLREVTDLRYKFPFVGDGPRALLDIM